MAFANDPVTPPVIGGTISNDDAQKVKITAVVKTTGDTGGAKWTTPGAPVTVKAKAADSNQNCPALTEAEVSLTKVENTSGDGVYYKGETAELDFSSASGSSCAYELTQTKVDSNATGWTLDSVSGGKITVTFTKIASDWKNVAAKVSDSKTAFENTYATPKHTVKFYAEGTDSSSVGSASALNNSGSGDQVADQGDLNGVTFPEKDAACTTTTDADTIKWKKLGDNDNTAKAADDWKSTTVTTDLNLVAVCSKSASPGGTPAAKVKVNFLKEDSTKAEGDAIVKTIEVASGGTLTDKKTEIPSDATALCVENIGGKVADKRFTGWKKLESGAASVSEVTTDTLTASSGAPTFSVDTSYVAQCKKRPTVTFKKTKAGNNDNIGEPIVVDNEGKLPKDSAPKTGVCDTGKVLKGWKNKDDDNAFDLSSAVQDNTVVYADCQAPSVTFKANGGALTDPSNGVVEINDQFKAPTMTAKSDRTLMGWRLTKKGEGSHAELNKVYTATAENKLEGYTPTDGDELTAVWGVKVVFNSDKDSDKVIKFKNGKPDASGTDGSILVEEGTVIPAAQVPSNELACAKGKASGKTALKGWDKGSSTEFDVKTAVPTNTGNKLELTAMCDIPVTVKFDPNGEGAKFIEGTEGLVSDGDDKGMVVLSLAKGAKLLSHAPGKEALIRVGYEFDGWNTAVAAASGTDVNDTTVVPDSTTTTYYAKWEVKNWTVTYKKPTVNGGTLDTDKNEQVGNNGHPTGKYSESGEQHEFSEAKLCADGYEWTGWNDGDSDIAKADITSQVITKATTYTAVCKAKTVDPGTGGHSGGTTPGGTTPGGSTPGVTPGGSGNSGSGSGSGGGSVYVPSYSGGGSSGGYSDSSSSADKSKDNGKKPAGKKPAAKKPAAPQLSVFDKQFTKPVKLPANAVVRSAGADRVATSLAALSLAKNKETVVLATGNNFPDALTGGALAGALKAGVVLTTSKTMEQSVVNALKAQGTKTVYIVGGQSVVPTAKEAALKAVGLQVVRLAGADRYETAALVKAETLKKLGGKAVVSCNATGANFPDALACASAASLSGGVVDLVRPGQSVAVDKVAGKTICAGGSACSAASGNVTKVVGSDRYETAYLLASTTPAKGKVLVANGMSYADSLVAGALAGSTGANLVLSNAKRVNVPAGTTSAHLFGGNAVLPDNLPMYTK